MIAAAHLGAPAIEVDANVVAGAAARADGRWFEKGGRDATSTGAVGMRGGVHFDSRGRNGRDVRALPLVRRKALLWRMGPRDADQVDRAGRALFALACGRDLEGIVAKWMQRPIRGAVHARVNVKNPAYTGARDRHELMG